MAIFFNSSRSCWREAPTKSDARPSSSRLSLLRTLSNQVGRTGGRDELILAVSNGRFEERNHSTGLEDGRNTGENVIHFRGRMKDTFISVLATITRRSATMVTAEAPMAESSMAARNPPCTMPAGFKKRSSALACHTVRPGTDLSTHVSPSVRSQFGGIWSATWRGYLGRPHAPQGVFGTVLGMTDSLYPSASDLEGRAIREVVTLAMDAPAKAKLWAQRHRDGTGAAGCDVVGARDAPRPDRSRLERPRPLHPELRPRLYFAVLTRPPVRLRRGDQRHQRVSPSPLQVPGTPREGCDAHRRSNDGATRPRHR